MSLPYDDLDAALTDACADRDAIAADLRAAREEVERLRAELAEARATIDRAAMRAATEAAGGRMLAPMTKDSCEVAYVVETVDGIVARRWAGGTS